VPTTTGETRNTSAVELSIKNILAAENSTHALTDKQITEKLHQWGYVIARRTVTKYRERMGFPGCRVREQVSKKTFTPELQERR